MNEINVISPYKHLGMWVFDDARVGLNQEPFVAGADTWIDRVVADIPNADRGFALIFILRHFPRASVSSRLAPHRGRWQLVLFTCARYGRLVMPGAVSLFCGSAKAHLRSGQGAKIKP
jgi:hypothetical protein